MKILYFILVVISVTAFGIPKNPRLTYFCETYLDCREQFRNASGELISRMPAEERAKVQTGKWTVPSKVDNDLTSDWVYLPATKQPKNLILVTSGTHGVEGYLGSAVQKLIMKELLPAFDRQTTGVLLVHAINPYGFKYLRRVSENNVDLNRNFDTNKDLFKFHNIGYEKLNYLLNPEGSAYYSCLSHVSFLARIARVLAVEKMSTLRTATLQGQYEFPRGVYYGGKDFEPQKETIERFLDEKTGPYQSVMHLDLHTGYGNRSFMHLFPNVVNDAKTKALTEQVFAGYPIEDAAGEDFYETYGDFSAYVMKRMHDQKKQVVPMVLEYGTNNNLGTRGSLESLRLMILENQMHWNEASSNAARAAIQKDFFELYLPSSEEWRVAVMETTAKWLPVFLEKFKKVD